MKLITKLIVLIVVQWSNQNALATQPHIYKRVLFKISDNNGVVPQITVSPQGHYVLIADGVKCSLYNTSTNTCSSINAIVPSNVIKVIFSPDEHWVCFALFNKKHVNTVSLQFYDLLQMRIAQIAPIKSPPQENFPVQYCFSPDSKSLCWLTESKNHDGQIHLSILSLSNKKVTVLNRCSRQLSKNSLFKDHPIQECEYLRWSAFAGIHFQCSRQNDDNNTNFLVSVSPSSDRVKDIYPFGFLEHAYRTQAKYVKVSNDQIALSGINSSTQNIIRVPSHPSNSIAVYTDSIFCTKANCLYFVELLGISTYKERTLIDYHNMLQIWFVDLTRNKLYSVSKTRIPTRLNLFQSSCTSSHFGGGNKSKEIEFVLDASEDGKTLAYWEYKNKNCIFILSITLR